MLRSVVPSWVKKAAYYRLSRETAELNLWFLHSPFSEKAYSASLWQPLMRKGAIARGLK